ncbi:MAG: NAD(P)H-dependent oxidoreductase [Acidihalobacter sp.]
MGKTNIGIIVGSLASDSMNAALANTLERMVPSDVSVRRIRIDDLPLYNSDDDDSPAPSVQRLRNDVGAVDGVVFVTPEYNRSMPGVLKNALDHASRPYGESRWAQKPAGIIGASPGAAGTCMAQQHLRNVLAYLDMPTMGQPEAFIAVDDDYFSDDGQVTRPEDIQFITQWLNSYLDWVVIHRARSE